MMKKYDDTKESTHIYLKMDFDFLQELETEAKENKLNTSDYIRFILARRKDLLITL